MLKRMLLAVVPLAVVMTLGPVPPAQARTTYVTIGTGGVTGVYYPAGGAIAKIVNKKQKEYSLRVTVESTGGSVANLEALASGRLEFGIVQSDRQYQAYHGTADWAGHPLKQLRAVFSIHPEAVTIVANASKNIQTVADLKGKIVNIGNPGSGQRGNAEDLFAVAGIDVNKDLQAEEMTAAQSVSMLQDGRIDALFYTVGHPNSSIREAVAGAIKVNFVAVPADIVKKLTDRFPYYAPSEIPVADYPGVMDTENVPTFGVRATLCTRADIPDEVVYAFAKEVFEHLDEFRKLHPALANLTRESMLQGLSAPIHPGALKYYREAGLMQ